MLEYAVAVGETYTDLGDLLRDHQPDVALTWFDKAQQTWRSVLVKEPRRRRARVGMNNVLCGRTIALAKQGKYAQAATEADAASKQADLTPGNYFTLGRTYAVCSQRSGADDKHPDRERAKLREAGVTRAIDMLHQAVSHGYGDLGRLQKHKDLDSLRDRPEFKKVLEEAARRGRGEVK